MSENKYNHVFPEPKGDIVKLLYLIYFYFYFNDYAPENIHISGTFLYQIFCIFSLKNVSLKMTKLAIYCLNIGKKIINQIISALKL